MSPLRVCAWCRAQIGVRLSRALRRSRSTRRCASDCYWRSHSPLLNFHHTRSLSRCSLCGSSVHARSTTGGNKSAIADHHASKWSSTAYLIQVEGIEIPRTQRLRDCLDMTLWWASQRPDYGALHRHQALKLPVGQEPAERGPTCQLLHPSPVVRVLELDREGAAAVWVLRLRVAKNPDDQTTVRRTPGRDSALKWEEADSLHRRVEPVPSPSIKFGLQQENGPLITIVEIRMMFWYRQVPHQSVAVRVVCSGRV
jgi:hypothetical protein